MYRNVYLIIAPKHETNDCILHVFLISVTKHYHIIYIRYRRMGGWSPIRPYIYRKKVFVTDRMSKRKKMSLFNSLTWVPFWLKVFRKIVAKKNLFDEMHFQMGSTVKVFSNGLWIFQIFLNNCFLRFLFSLNVISLERFLLFSEEVYSLLKCILCWLWE